MKKLIPTQRLIGGAVVVLITGIVRKNLKGLNKRASQAQGKASGFIQETLEKLLMVQAMDISEVMEKRADVLLQDVLPDWWDTWEQEIDRVLAPLLPHVRSYLKKQIMDYHQMEETCAQMGQRLPQR